MFWQTQGSSILSLLEDDNTTLEDILENREIIQQVLSLNKPLIDYLTRHDILTRIFEYVIKDNLNQKQRVTYPFVCCEILCANVLPIRQAILKHWHLVTDLWSFLDQPMLPNPMQAYFTKLICLFFDIFSLQMHRLVKSQENFIYRFLDHLESPNLFEILKKFLTMGELKTRKKNIKRIKEQGLVKLIDKFDPKYGLNVNSAASDFLISLIELTEQPSFPCDDLLSCFTQKSSILKLIGFMSSERSFSVIPSGRVLIELIKRHTLTKDFPDTLSLTMTDFCEAICEGMEDVFNVLKTDSHLEEIETTVGAVNPLGESKLMICRLFSYLFELNSGSLTDKILELRVPEYCLDLFFAYEWNNFLHASVTELILGILSSKHHAMLIFLFEECKLQERILEAQRRNASSINQPRGLRLGYMGHLTIISDAIIHCLSDLESELPKNSKFVEKLHSFFNEDWDAYIHGPFTSTKSIETRILGGHAPSPIYEEESFEQLTNVDPESEQFARFICQQILEGLPDRFDHTESAGLQIPISSGFENIFEMGDARSGDEDEEHEDEDDSDDDQIPQTTAEWIAGFSNAYPQKSKSLSPPLEETTSQLGL